LIAEVQVRTKSSGSNSVVNERKEEVVMLYRNGYWTTANPDGQGYADEWVEEGQLRNLGSNIGIM
jgi:hypothetical protein